MAHLGRSFSAASLSCIITINLQQSPLICCSFTMHAQGEMVVARMGNRSKSPSLPPSTVDIMPGDCCLPAYSLDI